jgi:hypothetical protein
VTFTRTGVAAGNLFPIGQTAIAYTATDPSGNVTTAVQLVTVADRERPALTVPNAISVPNDPGKGSAVVTYTTSATDNSGSVSISCTTGSGGTFAIGATTVTCTATDPSGNSVSGSFTVTVRDVEAPKLTQPADIGALATGPSTLVTYATPSATDNAGPVSAICSPASGSGFPMGTTVVTCTATDAAGNSASMTFKVTISDSVPVVTAAAAQSLAEGAAVTLTVASFTDKKSGHTATINWGDGQSSVGVVSESNGAGTVSGTHTYVNNGSYTVTTTVLDSVGGSGSASFGATVANSAPGLSIAGNQTVGEGSAAIALGSFVDGADGPWKVTVAWGDGSQSILTISSAGALSAVHTYADNSATPFTVSVTVADAYGAATTKSLQVTVTNVAPSGTLVLPTGVLEGSAYTLGVAGVTDPSSADTAAGFTYAFDCGSGSGYGAFGTATSVTCAAAPDNGSRAVGVKIRDKDGGISTYTSSLSIANVAPTVKIIGPSSGTIYKSGATIIVSVTFTDPGKNDQPHTCSANWGDGTTSTGTVSETLGSTSGSCTLTHAYTVSGTFTVTVSVKDKDGGVGTASIILYCSGTSGKGRGLTMTSGSIAPIHVSSRPAAGHLLPKGRTTTRRAHRAKHRLRKP